MIYGAVRFELDTPRKFLGDPESGKARKLRVKAAIPTILGSIDFCFLLHRGSIETYGPCGD